MDAAQAPCMTARFTCKTVDEDTAIPGRPKVKH
jgi:hypothetical protein